jgi:hypothetical protein
LSAVVGGTTVADLARMRASWVVVCALMFLGCDGAPNGSMDGPSSGANDLGQPGGGGGGDGGGGGGPTAPPVGAPTDPAVARGGMYFGTVERFNRYYTDESWQPARTVYVSANGSGDGTTRATPQSVTGALAAVTAGTKIVFLAGTYDACWELSDREGTYDAPIVLYAERNGDGTRGVHVNCCATGRQTCINLEGARYVAVDGFELQGGRYGVRVVGTDYNASAHNRGAMVVDSHIYGQTNDPILTGAADWAVFERNLTHDAGTGDGHGIYLSNGSDWNIVRFNETHSNASSDFQINADPLSTCANFASPDCDARAGTGEGGAGASDHFLVEGNYFHHGKAQGPNFTGVRYSMVRNNVFGFYARHGTSFWQETDNPNLGSHDNQVLHNLFIGTNSNQMLQFIVNSGANQVKNNIFVGAVANATAMEVDNTVGSNVYAGNVYLSAALDGRTANSSELSQTGFDPSWFVRFPTSVSTAPDFHPTASAPWLNRGELLPAAPLDRDGKQRANPADPGPYEAP